MDENGNYNKPYFLTLFAGMRAALFVDYLFLGGEGDQLFKFGVNRSAGFRFAGLSRI